MSDFEQTKESRDKNAGFFLRNIAEYSANVDQIDTYQRIRSALTAELGGMGVVLDVGNGGVFDYDTSVVKAVTGLDLFLDDLPKDMKFPANVTMERGDALAIPKADASYDGVVMVMLLHHLTGKSVRQCKANLERAVREAHRVLRPGGRLVIVESCVPRWFHRIECALYPAAVPIINRTLTHPPAFQHTIEEIVELLRATFDTAPAARLIPKGKFVLQLGFKVPSWLTPVQAYLITACKR
jgi:SAM-dependent methyltransferase